MDMKTVNVRYQYDEGDIEILNRLFSGVFRLSPISDAELERQRNENLTKFSAQFADNVFQDEYAVFYELIARRRLTTGPWSEMLPVVDENREIILNAQQVNLAQYDSGNDTDSDSYDAFVAVMNTVYDQICALEFPGSEGFDSAVHAFVEVHEKKYMRHCLAVMGGILNAVDPYVDWRGGRRREYIGYKGACEFIAVEKGKIDALRTAMRVRQFAVDENWLEEQTDKKRQEEREKRMKPLCDLDIPEIDDVWAGLRRTRFIGIIGPPKGGKTTFAAFMVHRLLKAGMRVAVWAMEGSAQESWLDKLIAARCYEDFGCQVTARDVSDGNFSRTSNERSAIMISQATIAKENRLSFIEETGYEEDFIDVIDSHYRAYNKFDAIVIDSLLNLQTRTGRRKVDYLSSAYILLKDYVEHKLDPPPVCIATAQFKQEAIKEAHNTVDVSFDETSGGETAETMRTPDEVIGIFGTPQQKAFNRTTLHHIASRHSALFPKTLVRVNFGSALFESDATAT
jgi:hypothetical protein